MASMMFAITVLLASWTPLIQCQAPELVMYLTDHGTNNLPGAIYRIHIHHMNFSHLPLNVSAPTAIDYDMKAGQLYWTDTGTKQIRTADQNGENDTLVAQLNSTSSPGGITLDSDTRQIFYTDMGNDVIVRIEMDTFESTVIVNTNLARPRGIVADTKNKTLFWVDRESSEKIESCAYDGTARWTVVKVGVVAPNGITLDHRTRRLYWADAVGHIEYVFVNGTGRGTVFNRRGVIFNDISYFNGFLYFSMLNYQFLLTMPVHGRRYTTLSSRTFQSPVGIHAFSPNYNVTTPCADGRYGFDCELCGNCISMDMCERTTGTCLGGCQPGYQRELCKEVCEPNTYGEDCGQKCGNCTTGTVCDPVSGKCPSGCTSGYKGDKCNEVCGPNSYGDPCQDCGSCAGGVACDKTTGECPRGCMEGYQAPMCEAPCPPNTYGPCTPCGRCADGAACNVISGSCDGGCQAGWTGKMCDKESDTGGQTGVPLGLIIGVSVGLTVVIIAVVLVVGFVIWRKRKGYIEEPYVELEGRAKENDYATLNIAGTSGVVLAPEELGQQNTMSYNISSSET